MLPPEIITPEIVRGVSHCTAIKPYSTTRRIQYRTLMQVLFHLIYQNRHHHRKRNNNQYQYQDQLQTGRPGTIANQLNRQRRLLRRIHHYRHLIDYCMKYLELNKIPANFFPLDKILLPHLSRIHLDLIL